MSINRAKALGAQCDRCPLAKDGSPVFPRVNANASIVALASHPATTEQITGRYLTGASGDVFWMLAKRAGIPHSAIHVANATLCTIPKHTPPKVVNEAIACCRPRLRNELVRLPTRHVMAMGNNAFKAVANKSSVSSWMGAPMSGGLFKEDGTKGTETKHAIAFNDWQVHPMYQPAYIARVMDRAPILGKHMQRAWKYSQGLIKPWVWPSLVIHESPEMFEALDHIKHCPGRHGIGSDVETDMAVALRSTLYNVGLSCAHVAVSVQWPIASQKLKDATCDVLYNGPGHIGQNYQFDLFAFKANGFDFWRLVDQYFKGYELMTSHRLYAPTWPHKLALQACYETHAERWKDEFHSGSDEPGGGFLYKEENAEPRALYNCKDSYIQYWLGTHANPERIARMHNGPQLYEMKRKLDRVAIEMTYEGIAVSRQAYEKHKKTIEIESKKALLRIQGIASRYGMDDFSPGSPKQIKTLFADHLGVQSTKYSETTGEPSYDANVLENIIIGDNEVGRELAHAIIHHRSWRKLDESYISGLDLHKLNEHGDIGFHTFWNPSGTKSNRWTESVGMQRMPKGKYRMVNGVKEQVTNGLRDLITTRHEERESYAK